MVFEEEAVRPRLYFGLISIKKLKGSKAGVGRRCSRDPCGCRETQIGETYTVEVSFRYGVA